MVLACAPHGLAIWTWSGDVVVASLRLGDVAGMHLKHKVRARLVVHRIIMLDDELHFAFL